MLPEPMPAAAPGDARPAHRTRELTVRRWPFRRCPPTWPAQIEPQLAQAGIGGLLQRLGLPHTSRMCPCCCRRSTPSTPAWCPPSAEERGWSGCIVTNPNCTSTGLTVALKALQEAFGLRRVFAVSLQALSGAGYPGVASLDILDNVIPYIGGEEEKVEWEPRKMLGTLRRRAGRPGRRRNLGPHQPGGGQRRAPGVRQRGAGALRNTRRGGAGAAATTRRRPTAARSALRAAPGDRGARARPTAPSRAWTAGPAEA